MQVDFEAIREQTERMNQQEEVQLASANWIAFQMPSFKKWYLKKNQQKNYIRVTRLIPPIDNAIELPSSWICKLQIWVKNELKIEERITPEAFEMCYNDKEWEKGEIPGTVIIDFAKLKPKQ